MKELLDNMDEFIRYLDVKRSFDSAGTTCCWNFKAAIGETMSEKYQSLHCKIVELSNVLMCKGARGYFWIVCSPEISAMFDTANMCPASSYEYFPMGVSDKQYIGTLAKRWRIYVDPKMIANKMLIGHNCIAAERCLGAMSIANFID